MKEIRSTAPDGFARYDQAELGDSLTSFRAFFKEVCDCGGVGILFREEIRSTRGLCPLGRYDKGDSIATLAMTKKLGYKNFRDCAYLTLRKVSADSKMILQAVLRLLFRFLSLRSTVRSALFGYSFAYWRITAFSGGGCAPLTAQGNNSLDLCLGLHKGVNVCKKWKFAVWILRACPS